MPETIQPLTGISVAAGGVPNDRIAVPRFDPTCAAVRPGASLSAAGLDALVVLGALVCELAGEPLS